MISRADFLPLGQAGSWAAPEARSEPLSRGARWCGCPAHGRNKAGDAEHILRARQRIGGAPTAVSGELGRTLELWHTQRAVSLHFS